jgi:hypothetical protein
VIFNGVNNVTKEQEVNELENVDEKPTDGAEENASTVTREFQVTVRKLEVPARPRGVLAE